MTNSARSDALRQRATLLAGARRTLLHGTACAVIGSGLFNLCRFGVIVLLARHADAALVGALDFATVAVAAPLVLFFGLELRAAYVTDAAGEFPFGAYRALRRLGMAAAAAGTVAVILLSGAASRTDAVLLFMLLAGLGRVVLNGPELYLGEYQRRERLDRLAISNILRGVAMLMPFAVLLPTIQPAHAAAALAAGLCLAGWLAVWLLYDRRWVQRQEGLERTWSWDQLGRLCWQTLPLGLVVLLINLCDSVPRWLIVSGEQGPSDLGHFAAIRVISLGVGLLMMQVATASGNRLVVYYHTDRRAFRRVAAWLLGVALGLGGSLLAATWLAGEWFLRAVYSPEYARHYPEFIILVAAQALSLLATVFGFMTTQMRRFWVQVPVQVGILAATTAAAAVFVPLDPVRGGALAALVRAGVQTGLYLVCVAYALRAR